MEEIPALDIVLDFRGIDESCVVFLGQKRVRELAEKLLQQARDAVHVVVKIFRVVEVHLTGIWGSDMSKMNPGIGGRELP